VRRSDARLSRVPFFLIALLLCSSGRVHADFQQRVDYQIDVTLNDSDRLLTGRAQIRYVNHSPDTLTSLYFRFPPAALRGGSDIDRLDFHEKRGRFARIDSAHYGNLVVHSVSQLGLPLLLEQDQSIGRVLLKSPLYPGDSTEVLLNFTTRFPTSGAASRIGYRDGQYKGAYWYPMICAYTPTYGWTVNRYYGTAEAYGEFGTFTLRYTVPNRYIVASTGELLNESEVLPPDRLSGIHLANPSPAPVLDGEEGERLVTWVYRAESVPDVAFAMDPRFLIERLDYGGFESWSFVRRGNAESWVGVAELLGWTVQQLEEIYGPYPWPRVMATDSWSAMEYPMLTMMSGPLRGNEYVFIHEVVHNYTPMIIHTNSVDAPALDEGFTTFVEHELAHRLHGSSLNRMQTRSTTLFNRKFPVENRELRGIRPYLAAVLAGEDLPMIRGADIAHDYPLLRASTYYKTVIMLDALRYTIGENRFWAGMRQYYEDNGFRHSDELDMMNSFGSAARMPVGWFFKQFLYSDADIDYGISQFSCRGEATIWLVRGRITRHSDVRLPVRFAVKTDDGNLHRYEIPFLPTDPSLPEFQRIAHWDQLHEPANSFDFELRLTSDARPVGIILDPDRLLVDRNPFNNQTGKSPHRFQFDTGILPVPEPPVDAYLVSYGPRVAWNDPQGLLPGVRVKGGYFELRNRFDLDIYHAVKPTEPALHGRFWGSLPLPFADDGSEAVLYIGDMQGDRWVESGLRKRWRTWGKRSRVHHATLMIGQWERAAPWSVTQAATPYLHFEYQMEMARGVRPGSFSAFLDAGRGKSAFTVCGIQGHNRLRQWGRTQLLAEGRAVFATEAANPLFSPTLGSESSYRYLGGPLLGGVLNKVGQNPSDNRLLTGAPASITSFPDRPGDWFLSWSLILQRPLMVLPQTTPWRRLITRFHWGVFQSGAIYTSSLINEPPNSSRGEIFEAGVQVSLEGFYGFTLRARTAPLASIRENSVAAVSVLPPHKRKNFEDNFRITLSYAVNWHFR